MYLNITEFSYNIYYYYLLLHKNNIIFITFIYTLYVLLQEDTASAKCDEIIIYIPNADCTLVSQYIL